MAWARIAIAFDLELGHLAVGGGVLAGYGVLLGAGKQRGRSLQLVAVGCTVLGLLLGKYLIVAQVVATEYPDVATSYVHPQVFGMSSESFGDFFSACDLLWVALALGDAIRFTAPKERALTPVRQARRRAPGSDRRDMRRLALATARTSG
ncbi:MAG: hypothetical protein IT453_22080 [Planctomycetes bacterium]|nr:hypothetical protein [Planctomycetota bacterium]